MYTLYAPDYGKFVGVLDCRRSEKAKAQALAIWRIDRPSLDSIRIEMEPEGKFNSTEVRLARAAEITKSFSWV